MRIHETIKIAGFAAGVALLSNVGACSDSGPATADDAAGDHWPAELVSEVHDQLQDRGYFPNAELVAEYPDWIPVIASLPADWTRADASSVAGLTAFQRDYGVKPTGFPDADTMKLLRGEHCGVPSTSRTAADKWKVGFDARWTKTNITYRIASFGSVNATTARAALSAGGAAWSAVTTLTFSEVTSGEDITVTFGACSGCGGSYSPSTNSLRIAPSTSLTHLTYVAMHELGHAIGLYHTGDQFAVMYPSADGLSGSDKTSLQPEDIVAANAWYGAWERLPGGARDIGVGRPNNAWIIGLTAVGGGYGIWHWSESARTWNQVPGGAVAIDVAADVPWIVNDAGNIYVRRGDDATGVWARIDGCARDIGGGPDGSVWHVGCGQVGGGYNVFKYVGGLNTWQPVPGGGVRIDVDHLGLAWLVNDSGAIFRGSGGAWTRMPGGAIDIGVGGYSGNRYPWIIGLTDVGGGEKIFTFAEQDQVGSGASEIRGAFEWVEVAGGASRVSVDTEGRAWIVNSSGAIFRRSRD